MIKIAEKITEKYIASAEDLKIPLKYSVLTFVAFVALRNFLEIFSDRCQVPAISFELHFHYYLFYICMALTMMLLFSAATGEKMARTARLILFSFFFIFLAPLLDLAFSRGQGYDMGYLSPQRGHGDLLLRYLTFGGSFEGGGITIGLRIEITVLLIASLFYFKAKKVSTLKSLLFVLFIYTMMFIYAIVPFIIKAILDILGLFENLGNMLYARFYLIAAFILLLAIAYKWHKQHVVSILKDMRPFRQIHALVMFAFGIILGPSLAWNQNTVFDLILVAISTMWACLFIIITNNLEDQEIDRIVNNTRPLVSGAITRSDYQNIAVVAGLLALIYAGAVSYYAFFTILFFMGLYSLYSMPPVRLKRVPYFSKLIIAINSLAFTIMGYVFAGGEVIEFPPLIILWFLVFFTAAMNLIDIKDYKGDKWAGIKTLPVLWGLKKSQRIIGLFLLLAYIIAPLVVGQPYLLIPAVIAGIIQYWLVNRKDYQEKWVFSLYLLSFAVLTILLAFAKHLAVPS